MGVKSSGFSFHFNLISLEKELSFLHSFEQEKKKSAASGKFNNWDKLNRFEMGSWFLYITFFVYYWIGIWILPLDFQRFIMLFLQHLHSITVILDFTLILCWMTDKLVKKCQKKPWKISWLFLDWFAFLKGYLLCLLMTPNNKNKWMEWFFL